MLPSRVAALQFSTGFAACMLLCCLPWPGLAEMYRDLVASFGNFWVKERDFEGGVRMQFLLGDLLQLSLAQQQAPWTTVLFALKPDGVTNMQIPIDLRGLTYLPMATAFSLGLALPGNIHQKETWWRKLRVAALGGLIALTSSFVLLVLAILAMLSGIGPVKAFSVSRISLVVIEVLHRALVSPPGMTYALPFFVWVLLVRLLRAPPTSITGV